MLTLLLGQNKRLFIAGSEAKPKIKLEHTSGGVCLRSILAIACK